MRAVTYIRLVPDDFAGTVREGDFEFVGAAGQKAALVSCASDNSLVLVQIP